MRGCVVGIAGLLQTKFISLIFISVLGVSDVDDSRPLAHGDSLSPGASHHGSGRAEVSCMCDLSFCMMHGCLCLMDDSVLAMRKLACLAALYPNFSILLSLARANLATCHTSKSPWINC